MSVNLHLEAAFKKLTIAIVDRPCQRQEDNIKEIIWHLERYCEDVIARFKYGEGGEDMMEFQPYEVTDGNEETGPVDDIVEADEGVEITPPEESAE